MIKPEEKELEREEEEENADEIEEESAEEDDEEEDEQEEEEEEEEDEEEYEEEEEAEGDKKPVKKRKCQRRKKVCWVCSDGEFEGEKDEDLDLLNEEEEEEEDEGEWDISSVSSVLSAVSIIWEDEHYEFEELCDPGTIYRVIKPKEVAQPEITDEYGIFRYLELCNSLNISPMGSIQRSLMTEEIDLSYRNLDNRAIRAISGALENNTTIKTLLARWNELRSEDCYYLGRVLSRNGFISYLDFTGCKLEVEALGFLVSFLPKNETVTDLILSKCNIGDEGMKTLAYVLSLNTSIENLDLSYNKLESEAGKALALVFMSNSTLTNLNLRYNNLFDPLAMKSFFRYLSNNSSIINLDMSWNGMSGQDMGTYIGNFLRKNQNIGSFDLSDNRFQGMAVIEIQNGLGRSRTLTTFKFGKNPLSLEDIESLMWGVRSCRSLNVLDLEDLWINPSILKIVEKLKKEREFEFNCAGILGNYEIQGPDYPKLILRRAQFEAQKPKKEKKKRDFGHLMWILGDEPMDKTEFMKRVKKFKAKVNKQLYPELIKQFTIPKYRLIDVKAMRAKYLSIFPDSTPPPPPKLKGKKAKAAQEAEKKIAEGLEGSEEESELMLGESAGDLIFYVGEYEDEEDDYDQYVDAEDETESTSQVEAQPEEGQAEEEAQAET